jgi:hypothetical protein
MQMNFSFIKNNEIDLKILIKNWNDNFSIHEFLTWKELTYMKEPIPKYFLSIFRNKTFYEFDLSKDDANLVIWCLDLVSFLRSSNVTHQRVFYNKSAHSKVIHGYLSNSDIKYDQEYGPDYYKLKQKFNFQKAVLLRERVRDLKDDFYAEFEVVSQGRTLYRDVKLSGLCKNLQLISGDVGEDE